MNNFLAQAFLSHDGLVSDKWEQYLQVYDAFLRERIEAGIPIRLLEIGIQNGGSLDMWSKVLPTGSTITGIDIDPKCASLQLPPNVRVRIGDASDVRVLQDLLGDAEFDIIVDDGSHRSSHIISTFRACFPRLAGDGIYFVEDVHASYWPEFGGGFRAAGAAMEWFKGLADALNTDHFRPVDIARPGVDELQAFGKYLQSISFFDSIIAITKLGQTKDAPYRRVLSGTTADVSSFSRLCSFLPAQGLRSLRLMPASDAAFSADLQNALAEAKEEIAGLKALLAVEVEKSAKLIAENADAETTELRQPESMQGSRFFAAVVHRLRGMLRG